MLGRLVVTLLLVSPLMAMLNCTQYSNATSNFGPDMCFCVDGYRWNNTAQPVGCYRNCSSLTHSNGTNNGQQECICKTYYFWNATGSDCYVNCSSLQSETNGTVNATDCVCNSGFYWNTTDPNCWLNCSNLSNTNMSNGNVNRTDCYCNDGFLWNSTGKFCYRDCSVVGNSTVNYQVSSPADCICRTGFTWTDASCQLDCAVVPYSTSSNSTLDGRCVCKDGYRWDLAIFLCVGDTTTTLVPLAYGLGLGIPLGLAVITGLGALIYVLAVPNPNQPAVDSASLLPMYQMPQPQPSFVNYSPYVMPVQQPTIIAQRVQSPPPVYYSQGTMPAFNQAVIRPQPQAAMQQLPLMRTTARPMYT